MASEQAKVERRHREEAARCILGIELTPDQDLGKNSFALWLNTGDTERVFLMSDALQLTAQSLANTEAATRARYAGLVEAARLSLPDMYGCALDAHADALASELAKLHEVNK